MRIKINFYLTICIAFIGIIAISCSKDSDSEPTEIKTGISIKGVIKDSITGVPVSNAEIIIEGLNKSYSTENGIFSIPIPEKGTYEVVIKKEGYYYTNFYLSTNNPEDFELKIEPFKIYNGESIVYLNPYPANKSPYPHHDPEMGVDAYNKMVNDLFILNNFGLYQGGGNSNMIYFHDGLDFMLPNYTKIFAIADGTVLSINKNMLYYQSISVADKNNTEYGWQYVHIANFNKEIGDKVKQGEYLGQVEFYPYASHIHLNRIKTADLEYDYLIMNPDTFFLIPDTEAPTINPDFMFFRNQTDILISKGSEAKVSGKVDIVVSMRDGGESNHQKVFDSNSSFNPGYGDRLAVSAFEYEIQSSNNVTLKSGHLDFKTILFKLMFNSPYIDQYNYVKQIFKEHTLVDGYNVPSFDQFAPFYVITNFTNGNIGPLSLDNDINCWDTQELKIDGTPLFPDGEYKILVRAYDSNGNSSETNQIVNVNNQEK